MPCPKDKRVDSSGRARKGSQRQIQTYVNDLRERFSQMVLEQLNPAPHRGARLDWVSPLREDRYNEYRDDEFLEKLGLEERSGELRQFWPKGGPCWDALGRVTPAGVVLIEAKSHVSELEGSCAASPVARARIEASLSCAKRRLGVSSDADWLTGFYQSANRYAHLLFLRDLGVEAWLVNVYFLRDTTFKPTSLGEWHEGIRNMKRALGLVGKSLPHTSELFLDAAGQ